MCWKPGGDRASPMRLFPRARHGARRHQAATDDGTAAGWRDGGGMTGRRVMEWRVCDWRNRSLQRCRRGGQQRLRIRMPLHV